MIETTPSNRKLHGGEWASAWDIAERIVRGDPYCTLTPFGIELLAKALLEARVEAQSNIPPKLSREEIAWHKARGYAKHKAETLYPDEERRNKEEPKLAREEYMRLMFP